MTAALSRCPWRDEAIEPTPRTNDGSNAGYSYAYVFLALAHCLLQVAVEEVRERGHRFARLWQAGILPEEMPHALEDVEVRIHARPQQLAMQQYGLAQAHIARAGKQKSGRVTLGDLAVERPVAGGSAGFRGVVPPKGARPEKAVDSPASSPFIVYRASPGFDPPEQVPSPTAPGSGSFCSGSHKMVVCASVQPPDAPNMPMLPGL